MTFPVIVAGNAPHSATGYGQQIAQLAPQLVNAGFDVALAANYGLQGAKLEWNGITVYPPGFDVWGNDTIGPNARSHFAGRRGWVITLFDVWVAKGPSWKEMNVASWVPVDHVPTPPKVVDFFTETGALPIAMSRFGERQLQNSGLEPLYAPHGIDTTVFRPDIPEINGTATRDVLGVPDDAHVTLMVAANKGVYPPRKSFPQALLAFSRLARSHDDAFLVLHTERFGMADGLQLDRLIEACGIPEDRVTFTDQYAYRLGLPQPVLAAIYNAADVLLAPSMGEGFGIPVVEAQACGLPVIVSDFSAQPELVGSGWMVGGTPFWDEAQASWLHYPDVGDIVDALEDSYAGGGDETKARLFAEEYDQRIVFQRYWRPIMAELERRIVVPTVDVEPINVAAL